MGDKITGERLAKVQEVFSLFDKDNDGAILTRQVVQVLRAVGLNPTEKDVKQLVEEADAAGEGTIDFNQFLELLARTPSEGDSAEDMDEAFRVFDPSASGTMSASELRHILTNMGEKMTEEEADDMIAFADQAGKGEVNYRELLKIILNDQSQ